MRKLLSDGLKLGESLARLPWKVARRMTGDRSETAKTAADLGERLGTLPFRAAQAVLGPADSPSRDDPTGKDQAGAKAGGREGERRPRVVVLGAGYAGLTCFLELQDHLSRRDDLVLVNSDKYHWFTTELHTYVAGEPEEAVRVPLSRVVAGPGRLVVGRVAAIDPAQRVVSLQDGRRVSYDLLVVGLGSDPEYYGLPGVEAHSLIIGNWKAAAQARQRIAALLPEGDEAEERVPHVVVAGGGLTGVELAGELADEYGRRVRLTIIEAGPEIMGGFASGLVRTARDVLIHKGIEIRTGNRIARVDAGMITFQDGGQLAFDLLLWAGGVRGSALVAQAGFATTPRGRGKVDAYLRAEGHPDVYLVGDSASFTDPATGREVPPSAQAAVQMGRAVGRNILHRLRGRGEEPFVPRLKGAFASLGRDVGVGQMGQEEFTGAPAMLIKELVEAYHAWETGGGVMPLVTRLVRAPGRFLSRRPTVRAAVRTAGGSLRPQPERRP